MPLLWVVLGLAAWEGFWWDVRRSRRTNVYQRASTYAKAIGRPLVVIGAPDSGFTSGYGCGDITVDLAGSQCPNTSQLDITKPLPFKTNSVCCITMCTLEYVNEVNAALHEINRISGGHAFFVGVEPWTLTAYLYPGARRTLPAKYR